MKLTSLSRCCERVCWEWRERKQQWTGHKSEFQHTLWYCIRSADRDALRQWLWQSFDSKDHTWRYAHLSFQYNSTNSTNSIKTLHNTSQTITQSSGEVSTLAGSKCGFADGRGHVAKFNGPEGICYDSSDESLVVCDNGNSRLRRVRLNGMWSNPLPSSWFFFPCFLIW